MSAETEKELSSAVGQQTPVIVKAGGNGLINIDSPNISFRMIKRPWDVSVAIERARIRQLTIIEGAKREDILQPDSGKLGVIRIEYGSEKIFVNDTAPISDRHMVIESTIPFDVTKPGESEQTWKASTSSTTFPPISYLRFTADDKPLVERTFTGQFEVELHVF